MELVPKPPECDHPDFRADVAVHRLSDSGRFNADVRIRCTACGTPFQFRGLRLGIDTDGARVSMDGQEARLAIVPNGKEPPPWNGVTGMNVTTYRGTDA